MPGVTRTPWPLNTAPQSGSGTKTRGSDYDSWGLVGGLFFLKARRWAVSLGSIRGYWRKKGLPCRWEALSSAIQLKDRFSGVLNPPRQRIQGLPLAQPALSLLLSKYGKVIPNAGQFFLRL